MLRESKAPNLYAELFQRHDANPILTARDWPYPAHTVFNAGACQVGDETVLLVRVEDRRGHSHLTVARSNDGVSAGLEPVQELLARVRNGLTEPERQSLVGNRRRGDS